MSTRWLVIVVACVVAAVLIVTLVVAGDDEAPTPQGAPSSSPAVSSPAPPAASPSLPTSPSSAPSPSPSASPASAFTASGDYAGGWYWLRDDANDAAATWQFVTLPPGGDLVFVLELLATDAIGGARGQDARFFFAWAPSVPPEPAGWAGRLPVTLPNVSPADDPLGYTCRGTVTVPRSTLAGATTLVVRISRDDVRGELTPTDVHIGVVASSVALRLP